MFRRLEATWASNDFARSLMLAVDLVAIPEAYPKVITLAVGMSFGITSRSHMSFSDVSQYAHVLNPWPPNPCTAIML
jgi:hypothetical protein